ncbi:transposase [Halopolyspora algeriensis]|uniref:Transposase n=1 Tax=Halopolyspora algeriensis TaxID=1500506 RepID=A0A368V8R0_9ACTN|nr:IS5 family transposase [Halopolyspora algeriensis]RCW36710.1 transposase [Halopolyspora algeriensis]TQM55748.1 transposase [Halopolyspora algeriensis]TQM56395.1 transposase [Halopolyspora algeriensis]
MLSCRIPPSEVVAGQACCRLAECHRAPARPRRYPSDTTEAQWATIDPLLPDPAWLTGKGGRREVHCRRAIVDAIFYLVDNGIKWRALPPDFPPWSTVYNYFAAWEAAGITQQLLDELRDRARLRAGRHAAPSAGIIDSASVKAAETVSAHTRGFDAGKKINGRKRHIAVDTLGLMVCVLVTSANVQDRTAARHLLARLRWLCPTIQHLWADAGYTGTLLDWARHLFGITIDIVAKLAGQTTFVVLPRRWVVERTLAWINQHRRCVRDYERLPHHHEAMVRWAMIRLTSKRLIKPD